MSLPSTPSEELSLLRLRLLRPDKVHAYLASQGTRPMPT